MATSSPARTDVALRAAHRGDLERILFLLEASGLPAEGVEEALGASFVVAQRGSALVGVAGIERHGGWGLLRSVAVRDDQRGTGLGRVLVENRVEWARARGLFGLGLFTLDAAAFFAHLGFERVERGDVPEPLRHSSEFQLICPMTASVLLLRFDESGAQRKAQMRAKYANAAVRALGNGRACSPDAEGVRFGAAAYDAALLEGVPTRAADASLACGNPTALAGLRDGESVLDLGSGGGLDVLLAAKLVGPSGFVHGLDLTAEMVELARANQRESGVANARFLEGDIEAIPLPDASVDVVLSNCVLNLTSDKRAALREAHRVLRPGGRLAIADIAVRGDVSPEDRREASRVLGCARAALEIDAYEELLNELGFAPVGFVQLKRYAASDFTRLDPTLAGDAPWLARVTRDDGRFESVFLRATRT